MELRTIIEDSAFRGLIADVGGRMRNMEPAMRLVGQVVMESIDENFAAQGRPSAWAALSDETLKRKRPGLRILEGETGRLREGIHVEEVGHDFVDVAPDDLPYARSQHLGGQAGRGLAATIPAREYMVLQESDDGRIDDIIGDYLMGGA